MLDSLLQAVVLLFDPTVLLTILGASLLGLVIGAVPGLTAVMGTALLVPLTFFMDPLPAIAAIVSMTAMVIFAGDVPAALLRIPGTPASAAYTEDVYAWTRRGKPEVGLSISLATSVIGGLIGTAFLLFATPMLARFALGFSTAEYFWLALLGLSCAAFVGSDDTLKSFMSLLIGLAVATVGIDSASGVPRFTFGSVDLMGGINLIPALVGMFAIAQIMQLALAPTKPLTPPRLPPFGRVTAGLGERLGTHKRNIVRGGVTGTLIGVLPGAGADIAAWISYAISKRTARRPAEFGKGSIEALSEAGASNNGALAGAWVPTLVFGIPGDSITAIVIGVLILKGIEPGPTIFIEQSAMVYAILLSFVIANLLLLPLGLLLIRYSRIIIRIPPSVMPPLVLVACIIGSFAINSSIFDVWVMLAFGVLGWLMERNGISVAPAILGIVLGGMIEFNFMTTMLKSGGDPLGFFDRPVAAALGGLTILVWSLTLWRLGRSIAADIRTPHRERVR